MDDIEQACAATEPLSADLFLDAATEEEQDEHMSRLAGQVLRVTSLLSQSMDWMLNKEGPVDYSLLTKHIGSLPKQSAAADYARHGLWTRLERVNQRVHTHADAALQKEGTARGAAEADKAAADGATRASFKEWYLQEAAALCADDLDALRQEPSFTAERVGLLLHCLEAGIDVWNTPEQELFLANFKA